MGRAPDASGPGWHQRRLGDGSLRPGGGLEALSQRQKYMEVPLSPEDLPLPERITGEIERKAVGQEEIEGLLCDELVVRYSSETAEGGVAEMYFWISQQLKVPIRTEAADLNWKTELKDIKIGPQVDELFEIPQGYEAFVPPLEFLFH